MVNLSTLVSILNNVMTFDCCSLYLVSIVSIAEDKRMLDLLKRMKRTDVLVGVSFLGHDWVKIRAVLRFVHLVESYG